MPPAARKLILLCATLALTACAYDAPAAHPDLSADASAALTGADAASDTATASDAKNADATVAFVAGAPVQAPDKKWQFIPVPGTYCRDGKETGFAININSASDKLVIYMEGGGACFNELTCLMNPSSYKFGGGVGAATLQRDKLNPFADWNMVYIPYCSGDVFSGTNPHGFNGQPQVGYTNVGKFLERVVPTFAKNVSTVVLTGSSAGGFGTAWNWLRVQDAFGPQIPVHALHDSGPPMSGQYLPPCMQQYVGALWGWQDSVHPACTACDVAAGQVVRPLVDMSLQRQVGKRFGLLSNTEDGVIKTFFAFGLENCSVIGEPTLPPPMPIGFFPDGLTDLRQHLMGWPGTAVFEVKGTSHVVMNSGDAWQVTVDGTTTQQWLTWFRDGDPQWQNVVP